MGAQAEVAGIFNGQGFGGVAQRLLANGMSPKALRTLDTLRHEEWKEIDAAVVEAARQRTVGVGDLISRGLTYNLSNGLGTTVLSWEDVSDMEDAQVNMSGVAARHKDRVDYSIKHLPLPIIHSNFSINARVLEASRRLGQPLDTTQAGVAAKKVMEKAEDILFNGASITFGGGSVVGLTTCTRSTGSLQAAWTSASSSDPVGDAIAMKQASITARHYGPWIMYVPTAYEASLDADYNTTYPSGTVRDRIKQIEGIVDVKVVDKLATGNVLLVELQPDTIRMVVGMQPTPVEWETEGGLILHNKVMAILVPQIRADQASRSGVVHYSA